MKILFYNIIIPPVVTDTLLVGDPSTPETVAYTVQE